jgi:hypothetical protein
MKRRLLLIAIVATLLLGALALPAASTSSSYALSVPFVVYADDIEPTPTPTATPVLPNGSCQSSGQCGN